LFITIAGLWFAPDMRRIFVLSTFICFATICACQKQDSAAEAQLAQRKAELDTREKALDEREKALVEREKALANSRIIPSRQQARNPAEVEAEREKRLQQLPPEVRALIPNREQMNSARLAREREPALQGQTPDPKQAKAEREKRIQELPPEFQALIRDRSLNARTAEKGTATEDRTERLRRLEEERRKKMSAIASPNAESSDAQPSSPSPSPTPE
jgi:actin cytoskeleton-regulatory complex protein PAN1